MSESNSSPKKSVLLASEFIMQNISWLMDELEQRRESEKDRTGAYVCFKGLMEAHDYVYEVYERLKKIDELSWSTLEREMNLAVDRWMETRKPKNWDHEQAYSSDTDELTPFELERKLTTMNRSRFMLNLLDEQLERNLLSLRDDDEIFRTKFGNLLAKYGLAKRCEQLFDFLKQIEYLTLDQRQFLQELLEKYDRSEELKHQLKEQFESIRPETSGETREDDCLLIDESVLTNFVQHARENQPIMSCGQLLGDNTRVREFHAVPNRDHSPNHWAFEAEGLVKGLAKAKDSPKNELVGMIYNKNDPDATLKPNQEAINTSIEDHLFIVVELLGDAWEARAFRVGGGAHEVDYKLINRG
jgi:hypothetical protein